MDDVDGPAVASAVYQCLFDGDEKYLDRALSAANSLNEFCKVNNAFAGINDVRRTNSAFIDDTQSFFFAEVIKYLCVTPLSIVNVSFHGFLSRADSSHSMTRTTSVSINVSSLLSRMLDGY